MSSTARRQLTHRLATGAAAALLAACAADAPVAPTVAPGPAAQRAPSSDPELHEAVAVIRRATARYRDLDAAIADGFVFLHACEDRPGEGPAGTVYVHMGRLTDGVIDPALPDALIYEPSRHHRPTLVGVEFAVPYAMWTAPQPPTFFGAAFQREDEFGVFGLHAWVWRRNPDGLFAELNPRVSCDAP